MRPEIVLLLAGMALAAGGCDTASGPPEQANASAQAPGNVAEALPARAPDRSHKGEAAPALAFLKPGGARTTLADFKGKPVLLNLWATWCAPCVKEMPTLDALAGELDGKVTVLTVSQDLQGAEKVDPFFARAGYRKLQPYLDPDIGFSTHFNSNLPTTVLYDAEGKEVWRVAGEMDWTSGAARALVAEAS